MPTSWIEVADTAVKIGLGALITGASAYLLARENHTNSVRRDMTAKRVSILEAACASAEEYFSYCTHLYNVVGGMTANGDGLRRPQTTEEKQFILDTHETLRTALDARNRARSQVSLLGGEDALDAMTKYNETLGRFRKVVARGELVPAVEEYDEFIAEFREHKRAFYLAAASFLTKLGNGK